MKTCSKCKQTKETNLFPTRRSSLDGLDSWCKKCVFDYSKQKIVENNVNVDGKMCIACRCYKNSSEFGLLKKAKDGLRYECKSCRNLKARIRYETDPDFRESESIRHFKIYEDNRDTIIKRTNKWSKENKSKKVEQAQRRRARKNGQMEFNIPANYIDFLLKQQNGNCIYCECDVSSLPTTDHLIPLSRGGLHDIDNIKISCKSCNCSKHDKTLLEWLKLNNAIIKNGSVSEKLLIICKNIIDLITLYPDKADIPIKKI